MGEQGQNIIDVFRSAGFEGEAPDGLIIHLVRITGSRWAYVAGPLPKDFPVVSPQRVILSSEWALLCYSSETLDVEVFKNLFKDVV